MMKWCKFFVFNHAAPAEFYPLSLPDALPFFVCSSALPDASHLCDRLVVLDAGAVVMDGPVREVLGEADRLGRLDVDRKSTRLNSSHANISYAVFCLKKK